MGSQSHVPGDSKDLVRIPVSIVQSAICDLKYQLLLLAMQLIFRMSYSEGIWMMSRP